MSITRGQPGIPAALFIVIALLAPFSAAAADPINTLDNLLFPPATHDSSVSVYPDGNEYPVPGDTLPRITVSTQHHDYYREHRDGELQNGAYRSVATARYASSVRIPYAGRMWYGADATAGNARFISDAGVSGAMDPAGTAGYAVLSPLPWMFLGARAGHKEYGGYAVIIPLPQLMTAFKYRRIRPETDLHVEYDSLDASLMPQPHYARYTASVRLADRRFGTLNAKYSRDTLLDARDKPFDADYEIIPGGRRTGYRIHAAGPRLAGVSLHGSFESEEADAYGRLYYLDMKFGKVSRFTYTFSAATVGADWAITPATRLQMAYTDIRMEGTVSGNVESWPFTSTLQDLMGGRFNYAFDGTLRTYALLTAVEREWRPQHRFRAGITVIDLFPRWTGTSYNTAIFGWPRTDFRAYALEFNRLTIAVLHGTLVLPVTARTVVSTGLSQAVPLRVLPASTGSGTDTGRSTGGSGRSVWGGTGLELTVTYRFR